MADLKLLDLRVALEEETKTEKEIILLLSLVIQDFCPQDAVIEYLAGGFVNKVHKVTVPGRQLIVRVFTDKTESLTRPELSVLSMRAVQLAGLGPNVLAWFTNGVVYGYQEGEVLLPDNPELNNPDIRRKMTETVARINQIKADQVEISGRRLTVESRFDEDIRRYIDRIPDDYDSSKISKCVLKTFGKKDAMRDEADWVLMMKNSLELCNVFSHGDLWWTNVLYSKDSDTVKFIDYDLAGYHPLPLDLACIFTRSKMKLTSPVAFPQLTEDEQRSLCRVYISESRTLSNKDVKVTEPEVEILLALTKAIKVYVWFSHVLSVVPFIASGKSEFIPILNAADAQYQVIKKEYINFRRDNEHLFVKNWNP